MAGPLALAFNAYLNYKVRREMFRQFGKDMVQKAESSSMPELARAMMGAPATAQDRKDKKQAQPSAGTEAASLEGLR